MVHRSYFIFRGKYKNKGFMNKILVTNIMRPYCCSEHLQSTQYFCLKVICALQVTAVFHRVTVVCCTTIF